MSYRTVSTGTARSISRPGTSGASSPARNDSEGRSRALWLGSLLEGASGWAQVVSRMMLGLVFGYFAVQELLAPNLWTLYVPALKPTSALAVGAVEVHGWLLLMLAGSLVLGILPRLAGAVGALVMAEIVIALSVNGVNAIGMRDLGVLGLALAVMAQRESRWTISG